MIFSSINSNTSTRENVRLIALARIALWCVAQLFLLFNFFYLSLEFKLYIAEGILSVYLLSAILTLFWIRSKQALSKNFARMQLILDAVIMTLLFLVTGGAANPFASLLLFPLIISASTLSSNFTWFMVLLTIGCYGSLFIPEQFMPDALAPSSSPSEHQHHQNTSDSSSFSLHIIGMWFNFALSAILISIFVLRMRHELKQQQHKINKQREQLLRDEQLLGIATQAASAAHHMSTPLSTMAILVADLQTDSQDSDLSEDLELLAGQINNCKHVLDNLRHQARLSQQAETTEHFITQLLDEFRLLRPSVLLEQQLNAEALARADRELGISSDPALRMAILNILNNAADASPDKVSLHVNSTQGVLELDIIDYGIADENKLSRILSAADRPLESDKPQGMGIGLFLSHATINRHQGEIVIDSLKTSGTHIHISLPLKNLKLSTIEKDTTKKESKTFGSEEKGAVEDKL